MNKINYDARLDGLIKSLDYKPKLLLHACCAPCATACIERLKNAFDLTVYFYNPNMDTSAEYSLRASEIKRFCASLGIPCVVTDHSKEDFLSAVSGYEAEAEGGARCGICYRLRLKSTMEYAESNGYEYFATTLTVSPLKNAELLNKTGIELSNGKKSKYLPTDFKKRNGYLRSVELAKEYGLYRQNYCGCEFSKA